MLATDTDKHYETGMVSGVFDLFHIGHLNLLRRAKERCDRLIACVLADNLAAHKGKWPVIPLEERLAIVAAIRYVDEAVVADVHSGRPTQIDMWERYHYDACFSGDDWASDPFWHDMEKELNRRGADLVFFPYTKKRSSTAVQDAILPPRVNGAKPARVLDPALEGTVGAPGFRYLFPFDRVQHGERILIYGAGDVGQEYARQLAQLDFCRVVAFVDRNHATLRQVCGLPVWAPEALAANAAQYDRLVVASTRYHANITTFLRQLGMPPERVV